MNTHDGLCLSKFNIKKIITEKILAILQHEDTYRQSLIVRKELYRNIININNEEHELAASIQFSSLIKELFIDHIDLSQTCQYTPETLANCKRLLSN